jgi:D-3-phosphoglycerate dehydrogenase / 2-oxoglutarate reductase
VNCLLTDHVHPSLLNYLESRGIQYRYVPNCTPKEVEESISDFEILIVNSKIKIDNHLLDRANKLRLVGRLGSGMDGIDVEAIESRNIHFVRTPEANANAVAEHALGMLLALANKIPQCDSEVRKKVWHREKNRGWELAQKTVGVIGYGNTGSLFAKKMSGLVSKVNIYDKYVRVEDNTMLNVFESSLETLLNESDIISLHIPLDEETKGMVNTKLMSKCKAGVILINTSRGAVVATEDLIAGLERGYVGGACLDVYENEKVKSFTKQEEVMYARLYDLPNVVLTPHVAGWSFEAYYRIAKVLAEKMDSVLFADN